MTYQVKFTETDNPSKPPLLVTDQTINNETSLQFPGKNYPSYAPVLAESFLHLLENFASPNAPGSQLGQGQPVQGQLWYDTTENISLLKVFDGTNWVPAGSIKKSSSAPEVYDSTIGDIWVNISTQQMYIFSGSTWILVGPQYSDGIKTGPITEQIVDTSDITHNITTLYANDTRVVIISAEQFTPKLTMSGFSTIYRGININSDNSSYDTKFWGTASKAESLVINGSTVSSSNFIRTDVTTPSNVQLYVRANGGITIGSDLSFNIGTDANTSILYSKTSGNSIAFNLTNNSVINTVLYLDSTSKVGIGENNTAPQETLDVSGNTAISGKLIINGTQDSTGVTSNDTASIFTNGGLSVLKTSKFGGALYTNDRIYVGLDTTVVSDSTGHGYSSILPITDATYDLGTSTKKFRNIYASSFIGDFTGTFNGTFTGQVSATRLVSSTPFVLTGDVSSNTINFNGQSSGTATFQTTVSSTFYTSKDQITSSTDSDQLLVYRVGTGSSSGLKRVTKSSFLSNVATIPVGTILPFAGSTIPSGYLLCDGSEVLISQYSVLYQAIGYTYKPAILLQGSASFALPDLRGRFPLGRDNMDNGTTIPSKDNQNVTIDAGGGSANRVTDVIADTLGGGTGTENKSINVSNLPDHKHNLNSGDKQYYAVAAPGSGEDPSAPLGYSVSSNQNVSWLPNSGSVISDTVGTPLSIMNPYLTINYIIFTGVL